MATTGKLENGSVRKNVRGTSADAATYKVMIALRGIEQAAAGCDDRVAKHAAMRSAAKEARRNVVAWLKEQDVEGQYKRVSEATAFGTFTMECTAAVVRLLKRAPGVQSVVRVSDLPLEIVSRKR